MAFPLLSTRAREPADRGYCDLSDKEIARCAGIGPGKVRRVLRKIEKLGVVRVSHDASGRRIHIIDPRWLEHLAVTP